MIKNLHISRFKSIQELDLDCRRINLFIGEPNTGKSNILETLGMLSFLRYGEAGKSGNARQFFRFERLGNLFYDEVLDEPVEIQCDDTSANVLQHRNGMLLGDITKMVEDTFSDVPGQPQWHPVN